MSYNEHSRIHQNQSVYLILIKNSNNNTIERKIGGMKSFNSPNNNFI